MLERRSEYIDTRKEYDSTASDSQSEEDWGEWHYGDGICPSQTQFNMCLQLSYETWSAKSSTPSTDGASWLAHMDAFLDLLRDVPLFFHNPPQDVDITGGGKYPLVLHSCLEVETTDNLACEQRMKIIDYFQCIGFRLPKTYNSLPPLNTPLSDSLERGTHFTSIVLAWSYIICCRWVEILQCAGEASLLRHAYGGELEHCFWDLVVHSRWSATVKRGKATSYAPWMLIEQGKKVNPQSTAWVQITPDSSLAFNILLDFCISEGLEKDFLLGLGTVLMLTSRNAPSPKLKPPVMIFHCEKPLQPRRPAFNRLFESLDKCMSLSATQDALDSLLCSTFFDPSIPCNLVGASSLGIRKALLPANSDGFQTLLQAIADKKCYMSLLWHSVVYTHQAAKFIALALDQLPPICLVAAFWTNTEQSFLQVKYRWDDSRDKTVSRADEFIHSYYCQTETSVPWTPAPPFGSTHIGNLSLKVRSHYQHRHFPLSWRTCWVRSCGTRVPGSERYQIKLDPPARIRHFDISNQVKLKEETQPHIRDAAEEQSGSATSRLFNWHRHNDDGLWLDDGTGDMEKIRQLQQHPWIIDPFDDGGRSDPFDEDEDKHPEICRESILQWLAEVELSRSSFKTFNVLIGLVSLGGIILFILFHFGFIRFYSLEHFLGVYMQSVDFSFFFRYVGALFDDRAMG